MLLEVLLAKRDRVRVIHRPDGVRNLRHISRLAASHLGEGHTAKVCSFVVLLAKRDRVRVIHRPDERLRPAGYAVTSCGSGKKPLKMFCLLPLIAPQSSDIVDRANKKQLQENIVGYE